jgi:hypothetical protein
MIAAIIIAKNPQKFGFNNVPYQKPLTGDQWEVAESRKETTPARAGILGGAARVQPPKNGRIAVTQERSQPLPLTSKEGENSGKKLQSPPKKRTRLALAGGRNHGAQAAQKGEAEPYQGSIIGASPGQGKHKSAKAAAAKTHKRKSHLAAKTGHGKKRPATRLAKKDGTRYSKAKGHKKKNSNPGNSKEAKTKTKSKSKKMLLSQNR